MTPEGKVKAAVSKFLKSLGEDCYYEMPVPSGFGKSGLDYTGTYFGRSFYIETKKPGGKPTPRQLGTIAKQRRAGAAVFVIDSPTCDEFVSLSEWCRHVREVNG
jgi:hypothetical protein